MPLSAIYSAIHEGGHAIYEQNVNPDYDNTAAGGCRFMGLHENQSRFYENILGRNKNFWIPIYEKLGELLPQFKNITLDEFYREVNHVRNSFIRTEADEVTYAFHVILAEGKILEITKWLNEKIHRFGSTRTPKETLLAVCGKEVTAEPIIRYFKKKYTEVYDLA